MLGSIPWLPLGGFLFGCFGGSFFGSRGTSYLTIGCIFSAFIFSLCTFYRIGLNETQCIITLCPWINADLFNVSWTIYFDTLTATICVVVTSISCLVHVYSTEYIKEDPHLSRFLAYLSLFTFFILILVSGENFIQLFLGWEGVGLSSYLLINFWFTRLQANKAAIKAIIVNRIGDFGLALGIFTVYSCLLTVDYSSVFALGPSLQNQTFFIGGFNVNLLNLIGFLLFVGAVGKSAQLGLHTWLPDAIEGPTPVSALIHAATIVTAGVFLLGRCSPLLEYASGALCVIVIVGGLTAFFAATTGLVQNDIKRVIAYSTCSQLGYIIFVCGLSQYNVGVFHLTNHAFFKALLFLGAGSVIHGLSDEQDIRKIGGLRRLLPFTGAMITIGSLSLIGIPFLTGFYSKDAILEVSYASYTNVSHFAYYLGSLGAFFTSFYSIRLIYLCFLSGPNGYRSITEKAHESLSSISIPLGILAIPSIFLGYIFKDLFIGLGTPFWSSAIFILPLNSLDHEFLSSSIKLFPLKFSLCGGVLALSTYIFISRNLVQLKLSFGGVKLYTFLNRKWFFDKVYNEFISQFMMSMSYIVTYKSLDRGLIENCGPLGLSKLLKVISISLHKLQSGTFYHNALCIVGGLALILGCVCLENQPVYYLLFLPLFFSTPKHFN
jgi:NADH-ubiquinone oxidoreductase chain 5